MDMKKMSTETACVHGTYKAKSGEPQHLPISQNTTYRYYNAKDVAELFDLESGGFMYTRLGNPTLGALEEKMALLPERQSLPDTVVVAPESAARQAMA